MPVCRIFVLCGVLLCGWLKLGFGSLMCVGLFWWYAGGGDVAV